MRVLKSIILVLLFCQTLFAQPEPIIFKNFSKGLSQNTITSITQDEFGFLWVGTYYGLNRYDGTSFKSFISNPNDSLSISGNYITGIIPDMNGGIWVSTYGAGLNYYDIHKDEFQKLSSNKAPSENSACLFETSEGQLLMGVNVSGLFSVDKENKTLTHFNEGKPDSEKLFIDEFFSIAEDKNGNILIARSDGLSVIRKKDKKVITFGADDGLPNARIRSLHCSESGRIWAGTDVGIRELFLSENCDLSVKKVNVKSEKEFDDPNNLVILSILEKDDYLWLGSENYGLYQIDLKTEYIYSHLNNPHNPYSLTSNSIWVQFEDRDENMWLGGFTSGLDKIESLETKIQHSNKIVSDNFIWNFRKTSCFIEDNNANIWVGSDIDGLVKIGKNENFENFQKDKGRLRLATNNIVSMQIDDEQNIWIGTWGGGVTVIDKNRNKTTTLKHDPNDENSIIGNDIHAMTKDAQGNIWIAAFRGGIDVFHPLKGKICTFKAGDSLRNITTAQIFSMIRDHDGNLWIGYNNDGIEKLILNEKLEVVGSERYLGANTNNLGVSIYSFFNDSKKNMWVATGGNGLVKFSPDGKMTTYRHSDGLKSNMVSSILEDEKGLIWVTSNDNICSLNPDSEDIQCFALEDENIKTEFFKSSCLRTKDGRLLFGSNNGIFSFRPELLKPNDKKPTVYITDLSISGKKPFSFEGSGSKNILDGQSVIAKHTENDLEFEFTSISYLNPSQNKFQYKLENHDDEWRTAGVDRTVSYPNVPPGKYIFKVKGANNDGLWNEKFSSCEILIKQPWYATIWAYLGYFLLSILCFVFIRKETVKRVDLKNQMKYDKLEIDKIKEIDRLKETFFTNVSHEFRTPLTLIMSPLEVLMNKKNIPEDVNNLYQTMKKNAEYLNRLINQILEISRLEAGQSDLKPSQNNISEFLFQTAIGFSSFADDTNKFFKTNIPKKEIIVEFEKEKIEKVIINLLSNAFKYSEENGTISISLLEHKDTVEIQVFNTGTPIPEAERSKIFERFFKSKDQSSNVSTGIGLTLSKQLVELHGGQISVESIPTYSSGQTTFTVILPKGEKRKAAANTSGINIFDEAAAQKTIKSVEAESQILHSNTSKPKSLSRKNLPLVLVVEDNHDMRNFICMVLKEHYNVLEAKDGLEGLEVAKEHMPELIISDVMMPNMDGFELAKSLKNDPKTCHIFLILLSAKSSEESIETGLSIGADNYLTKPFNPTQLELKVKNLLNTRTSFKEQIIKEDNTKRLSPTSIPYSNLDEAFIQKAIAAIEERISDSEFKVEHLCQAVGMSKSQLNRKLRGLVDKSPKEFIRMIRLKRAAQLLRKSEKRISEITFEVGFNDLQYFRTMFKEQYGVSPREFKSAYLRT